MKILESGDKNLLSTDLTGYVVYLQGLGFTDRHIEFLKLAPRLLFKLFGAYASLDFLRKYEYRSKFLAAIKHEYSAGTLKKYASGITHYRNYLIEENIISGKIAPYRTCTRMHDLERHHYSEHKSDHYSEVEANYLNHLTIEMAYSKAEIRKRIAAFQRFSSYLIQNDCSSFSAVEGKNIIEFISLTTTYQTDWNALRPFLKFAYREGYIPENLSGAILPSKKNRHREKKYLSPEDIQKILDVLPHSNVREIRTYAMFLLMARLGFRPSETVRVRLDDLDWVGSKILVRGKGKRLDWLPISKEVADAIIDYLKLSERGCSGFLFVQQRPPYKAVRSTYCLTEALKKAYEYTDIIPPAGQIRLNVFRHSFATSLINSEGQNFFTAQVFLRHSSPEMTLNYAKYHAPKLRLFEQLWPEDR